ncbi:Beta-lactamase-like protein 2 homolog [Geodia barretti]|uniref:Beta-lactamase-like protein 2 homolog n=1 Tax=Geodia barretti TaxID=519541 RepID=A0AA35X5C8_GEOBA|nr:Beta-lactamase-like protein 2 homolog [Geodia barretti]
MLRWRRIWSTGGLLGRRMCAAIVLTHRHGDHIGGAVRLRDATSGAVTCNTDEREAIESDLASSRMEDVPFQQTGVLFSGDMILGTGTTVISPEHGDMSAYIESMRKLLGYDARLIAPGHGPVIDTPQDKLNELITHRLAREEQIVGLVEAGNRSVDALLEAIYAGEHTSAANGDGAQPDSGAPY